MSETTSDQMRALRTDHLSLGYDERLVIDDLNLSIPTGKITALVGPNGSGKSTLLRAMARLLKPRVGSVYLEAQSIFSMPTRELAKQLGVLPQEPVAPEGMTVRDLVGQGRYPHQGWFQRWSTEDERIVDHALEVTGTVELADRTLDTLSGGQRQKAWIAMALAQDTQFLLLDEPTTFLDMAHQVDVLDLLHDLNETGGRTVVMVLHDLNQACRYADHLVVLRDGTVVAEGAPDQVVSESLVRGVFGVECRIVDDPVVGCPLCLPIGRRLQPRGVADTSGPQLIHGPLPPRAEPNGLADRGPGTKE